MTHDIARSIIVKDRGTHFDPDVVDAFLRCESKFQDVRMRFSEQLSAAA
jgi:putative two-component system response regulator